MTDYINNNYMTNAYNYAMNKYKTYRIVVIQDSKSEIVLIDENLLRFIKCDGGMARHRENPISAGKVGEHYAASAVRAAEQGQRGYSFEYLNKDEYEYLFYDMYAELIAP